MPESEIHAVEEAYRAALARLNIIGGFLSLTEWSGVDPVRAVATGTRWAAYSLRVIAALRRKSARLAIAYYRLARALDTGYAVNTPSVAADAVTLGELRNEFLSLVLEIATLEREPTSSGKDNDDETWFESEVQQLVTAATPPGQIDIDDHIQNLLDEYDTSTQADSLSLGVDQDFEWPKAVLQGTALEDLYGSDLAEILIKQHRAQAAKLPDDLTPEETIARYDEIHARSGVQAAGFVNGAGADVARDLITRAGLADRRSPRYARITSANPCAWCAMLASRGFEFRTAATAAFKAHDHCNCTDSVRWSDTATLPPLSAYFEDKWKTDIRAKRFSGKGALKEWRRLLYAERKASAK